MMRQLAATLSLLALLTSGTAGEVRGEQRLVPARDLKFEQKLDRPVPLDVPLVAEDGAALTLKDAVAGKPTVLVLAYYSCPRVCGLVLEGVTRSLMKIEGLDAGVQYQLVVVSFDPRETPSAATVAKMRYAKLYGRTATNEGFRFLTGTDANVRKIADAIGFSYKWDASSQQFAHPAGLVVLTPEGKTARYFFGIDFSPRDLKLALVESSAGRIGSVIDQVLLFCYGFDEHTGEYTFLVIRVMRICGSLTFLALVTLVIVLKRRERAKGAA